MPILRDVEERQVSGLVPRALMSYVERAAGPAVAQLALERADLVGRIGDDARSPATGTAWFTSDEVLRLVAEAGALCGTADLGRLVGIEQVIGFLELGARDYFVSCGSIRGAMEISLSAGMKMTKGRTFELLEEGESHLLIASDTLDHE
ncbi:MAG: hypothetical protein QOI47_1752, partial [Actinomycetota bacterium]|nr:hypothetical protein [Actinomycetota bacterium]